MQEMNLVFTDKEFERLKKAKGIKQKELNTHLSWAKFFLRSANGVSVKRERRPRTIRRNLRDEKQ